MLSHWQTWALMAAFFAALTAIFAKIGVTGINSNFATLIRTLVILVSIAVIVWMRGEYQSVTALAPKTLTFLLLSGLATGASWLCYFRALQLGNASKVAPVDKLSVVFVAVMAALFLGEKLSFAGWSGVGLITIGAALLAFG